MREYNFCEIDRKIIIHLTERANKKFIGEGRGTLISEESLANFGESTQRFQRRGRKQQTSCRHGQGIKHF